jgi:hypothetical protein
LRIKKFDLKLDGRSDELSLNLGPGVTFIRGEWGFSQGAMPRLFADAVFMPGLNAPSLRDDIWSAITTSAEFSLDSGSLYKITNSKNSSITIKKLSSDPAETICEWNKNHPKGKDLIEEISDIELKREYAFLRRQSSRALLFAGNSDSGDPITANLEYLKPVIFSHSLELFKSHASLAYYFGENNFRKDHNSESLMREQKDLDRELQILQIRSARRNKLIRERNTIEKEIESCKASLDSFESQRSILERVKENLTKVDDLKRDFENLRQEARMEHNKIKAIANMKKEIENLFPGYRDIGSDALENLDRLQDDFNSIKAINEKIDAFYSKRERKKKKSVRMIALGFAVMALGAFYVLWKNKWSYPPDITLFAEISLIAVLIAAAAAAQYFIGTGRSYLEKLKIESLTLKDTIRNHLEQSRVELDEYKLTEVYEYLLQYFEKYIDYIERKKDLAEMTSSLKEKEYLHGIKERLQFIKQEEELIIKEITSSINSLDIIDDIERERNRIDDFIENIDREINFNREKIETKRGLLSQTERELEQECDIEKRIQTIRDRKSQIEADKIRWEEDSKALSFLFSILDEAVKKTEFKSMEKFLADICKNFHYLTEGAFDPTVNSSVLLDLMSSGKLVDETPNSYSRDMAIAITLTMSDFMLDSGRRYPIIMDDPFLERSEERHKRLKKLALESAKARQVIFFMSGQFPGWGQSIEGKWKKTAS